MKKTVLFLFASIVFVVSCSKEDQDDRQNAIVAAPGSSTTSSTTSDSDTNEVTLTTEINDFIWDGLNQYYYWQEEVENLADSQVNNTTDYINFLNSENDPSDFFYSFMHEDDRNRFSNSPFSWIDDDYEELEDQLSGISASDGMKYSLHLRANQVGVIGAVTYVLPDSDAAEKGVVRGDLFNAINGQEMTIDNYSNLLNSTGMSYTIGLINYDRASDVVTPRNQTITLEKEENFQEVPIHRDTIIEHDGRRVGYLMLNRFLSSVDNNDDGVADRNFNQEMIDAFAEIATENIDDMVLDLRYNGGGSVLNGVYLASLLTGQYTDQIFIKQLWNSKIMAYIDRVNNDGDTSNDLDFNEYFTNEGPDGNTFTGLNLNRIYILTSRRTASASEMIINGLSPYMNEVITIGEATYGKNVGSITLRDYIDVESPRDSINPRHRYAMQPIVIKVANANNEADYVEGIQPDVPFLEDFTNYGTLGDPTEPFLAAALAHMSGGTSKRSILSQPTLQSIVTPQDIGQQRMIFDLPDMKIKDFFYKE